MVGQMLPNYRILEKIAGQARAIRMAILTGELKTAAGHLSRLIAHRTSRAYRLRLDAKLLKLI